MPKYLITATVEIEDELDSQDRRRLLEEVQMSAFTWDSVLPERIIAKTSDDIPVTVQRILDTGELALSDVPTVLP